ncbi:transmembrane protein 53 [Boleophthalmus pectinirostris]|uniref:transmembrane protein 53 n=1 Tax=Boleophthalmus pectinirostris TaxID=150288 RepID=UPI000A1C5AA5|nr:transmembrane protein 53 [Boleophthalmus pectinirostris]XP_020787835.1 transmembrane protein 53 [Boleophthalmus pectinirostris]XP_020787837.1 transmembrane protein 53 [Boleophthalmus pectinirostris]
MFPRAMLSRGISTQYLSKNVTLYVNELAPAASPREAPGPVEEQPRPLLLMLPWLGSRPHSVARYCDIYFRTGLDVLVVTSEVAHFLWPRLGLDHSRKILDLLQNDQFISRPLLVHAFSIGAYTFAQLLVHISRDIQQYESLTRRIKGQVYDSVVAGSLDHMATGLGRTLFPRMESVIKQASLAYFSLFKRQTVDYFDKGIDVFWNTPVKAPALFFYCKNDIMSNWETIDRIVDYWTKAGITVTGKRWEESTHAGHLKRHPEEYLSTINSFLHSVGVGHLQSKL